MESSIGAVAPAPAGSGSPAEVLERLETFRQLEEGWADGHRAISDAVVDTAAAVVRALLGVSLSVVPFDGAVSVTRTWPTAPEWEGRSVEILPDRTMTLVPDWPFEHEDSGVEAVAFDLALATAWLTEHTRGGLGADTSARDDSERVDELVAGRSGGDAGRPAGSGAGVESPARGLRASFSVEFTAEELAVVSNLAQAGGHTTVSSYLRACALGAHLGAPFASVGREESV